MLQTKNNNSNLLNIKSNGKIDDKQIIKLATDLSYNNALEVVVYDVRDKTPFVSYYVVASAKNEFRLKKLVQDAKESLAKFNYNLDHIEGKNKSSWILLDAKDVVLQLFTMTERNKVNFDDLYKDCNHKVVVYKEKIKNE